MRRGVPRRAERLGRHAAAGRAGSCRPSPRSSSAAPSSPAASDRCWRTLVGVLLLQLIFNLIVFENGQGFSNQLLLGVGDPRRLPARRRAAAGPPDQRPTRGPRLTVSIPSDPGATVSTVASIRTDFYQVPLPRGADRQHARRACRTSSWSPCACSDSDGAAGLGYTYAVNSGAAAFAVPDRPLPGPARRRRGRRPDRAALGRSMWWAVHYAGRGGPPRSAISALDIALWDLRARRDWAAAVAAASAATTRACRCYAGGIDLDFRSRRCSSRPTASARRASGRSR